MLEKRFLGVLVNLFAGQSADIFERHFNAFHRFHLKSRLGKVAAEDLIHPLGKIGHADKLFDS